MSDIPSRNAAALVDKKDETSRTSAPKATEETSGLPLMQVGKEALYSKLIDACCAAGGKVARPAL